MEVVLAGDDFVGGMEFAVEGWGAEVGGRCGPVPFIAAMARYTVSLSGIGWDAVASDAVASDAVASSSEPKPESGGIVSFILVEQPFVRVSSTELSLASPKMLITPRI